MARTIVYHGPTGLSGGTVLTARLVTAADAIEATITMAEATNAKGRYTGTIPVAPTAVGSFTVVMRVDGTPIGVYENITLVGDPEEVAIRDTVVDGNLVTLASDPSGVPPDSANFFEKIGWLFAALKNRITVDSGKKIFHDASNVAQWEKDVSDTGTTYTETKGNAP